MNDDQRINAATSKRDRLMSEIRDSVSIEDLQRLISGRLFKKDMPLIKRLAAIVALELQVNKLEILAVENNEDDLT